MKRYRILRTHFDMRANLLKEEIKDEWEPHIKELCEHNKQKTIEGLIAQFGALSASEKIQNFIDLEALPISVSAFHNKFLDQIRNAFVVGSYYSALTGACALGERILNQLIIHLREDFRHTAQYQQVYRKNSFDNWDFVIDILEEWDILLPDVMAKFRELKLARHRSIHFNPETDTNDRELALDAILKLQEIIDSQFSGFGMRPWVIPEIPGASFIKKEHEETPFVKRILLPSCELVGPHHVLEHHVSGWIVKDDHEYEDRAISDEEFATMYRDRA